MSDPRWTVAGAAVSAVALLACCFIGGYRLASFYFEKFFQP